MIFRLVMGLLWMGCSILSFGQSSYNFENPSMEDKQSFQKLVDERVQDLRNKIRIIGDKDSPEEQRIEAVNAAVTYFESERNFFEVSSKYRDNTRTYPVRQYFNRLRVLKYNDVDIDWYDAVWVTDLKKDRNGSWRGTVRVFQKFKGMGPEGELIYEDTTQKDINVRLDVVEVDLGKDNTKTIIRVLLGNVRVVETR